MNAFLGCLRSKLSPSIHGCSKCINSAAVVSTFRAEKGL